MSEGKLKTAILGLGDRAKLLLEAAYKSDYFQIQAVADKDTELAKKTAQKYECKDYDDYRRLITENQLDVLLVAAPAHCCSGNIQAAMKKKFNVLTLAPPAKSFEEAVEFVHLAEEKDIKFVVANTDRFAKSFLALREFLQEARVEQIFLITAFCNTDGRGYPAWQNDPKLAGGGVLLHNCYEIIDQLIWNFAMPQQVYSLNSSTAGDRGQRLYLTEDTAVVTMKFTDTCSGNLTASRCTTIGPEQEFLKVYGKDKILTVSNTRFIISDACGKVSEQFEYSDDDKLCCMTEVLKNFALSILSPDKNKLCSSGRENLKNMAVIESAYLSARTGMPEEPERILQMASLCAGKPIDI